MKMIILFTVCSLINVVLNTVKTIVMHKEEKLSSSLVNSICFGFYTIIVVMMSGDMALWLKVIITALTNFVGVWGSMVVMEKLRKDKLWLVKTTIRENKKNDMVAALNTIEVPFTFITTADNKHTIFEIYCNAQKESEMVKTVIDRFGAKYFVGESKTL